MTKLTTEEKEHKAQSLAKKLRPQHLIFANNILAGMLQDVAYSDAGYSPKYASTASSRLLANNKNVSLYIELSLSIAVEKASNVLQYNEEQWLADILEAVDMSLGRKEMVTQMPVDGGKKVEINFKEVNLPAFARLSEQLGKKLILFTEKKLIEGGLGLVTKSIPSDMPAAEAAAIYQEMIRGK